MGGRGLSLLSEILRVRFTGTRNGTKVRKVGGSLNSLRFVGLMHSQDEDRSHCDNLQPAGCTDSCSGGVLCAT